MRVFSCWIVLAGLVLASCGGKVVLDSSSGVGGFGTGTGSATGSSGTGITGGFGASGVAGGSPGGGPCVSTCAEALAQGGVPCGGMELTNYESLQKCAGCTDTGNCPGVCGASLCSSVAGSSDCTSCLQTNCMPETHACLTE
jgi:hypothetical protein